MILARGQAAPLRFLIGVLLLWVVARGAILSGWQPLAHEWMRRGPAPGWLMLRWPLPAAPLAQIREAAAAIGGAAVATVRPMLAPRRIAHGVDIALDPPIEGPIRAGVPMGANTLRLLAVSAYRPYGARTYDRPTGVSNAAPVVGDERLATPLPRWSGSAWAFVRGGGRARPVAPVGQIGGGQAGARALYRIDDAGRLAAAARLSRTIGGPTQSEAAIGIDWRPVRAIPLHVAIERRVALDRGGRDAWALGAAGGVYDVRLAEHWRLDGYGEAGVVGARRRDLYADGAIRIGRVLALGDGRSLTLGGCGWGAAQPHAARLDVGPSAVLRLPVERRTVAVALDYRARIAGAARPGSGAALTVGVDF